MIDFGMIIVFKSVVKGSAKFKFLDHVRKKNPKTKPQKRCTFVESHGDLCSQSNQQST